MLDTARLDPLKYIMTSAILHITIYWHNKNAFTDPPNFVILQLGHPKEENKPHQCQSLRVLW